MKYFGDIRSAERWKIFASGGLKSDVDPRSSATRRGMPTTELKSHAAAKADNRIYRSRIRYKYTADLAAGTYSK